MKKKLIISIPVVMSLLLTPTSFAKQQDLIPAIGSGLYYKIGGGNLVPLPAFYDTSYLPLNAGAELGLGFDCGSFNPQATITNSLNQIKSSFLAIQQQVVKNLTGAIMEFPLYELSRADPNLYNLLTNALAGAREDLTFATKSCQVMQSQIAAGQDPYAHWGQIALGNRWKAEIGDAALSGDGDVNEAKDKVSKDAGRSGIPWININSHSQLTDSGGYHAGGVGQAPIHVIHDSALAGYQVVEGDGSQSSHGLSESNTSELSDVWTTPKQAADWIVDTVGDQTITTYAGGEKRSQPGVGLYAHIEKAMQTIKPKLTDLVTGQTPLTVKSLQAVSSEGLGLTPDIIRSIQKQSKVMQAILIDKLAQSIATLQVMKQARLAIRVLQSGKSIPAVYNNKSARKTLDEAVSTLQQAMQNILLFVKAKQTLMSNMLSTVAAASEAVEARDMRVTTDAKSSTLEDGAIKADKS